MTAILDRYFNKVDMTDIEGCWPWTGTITTRGYGQFWLEGKNVKAHRIAWMIANFKDISEGMVIRHTCDYKSCCNPSHLLLGTNADNSRDMTDRDRQSKGSNHGMAKLNETQVVEIKKMLKDVAITYRGIGELFNVAEETIGDISRGQAWRHVK